MGASVHFGARPFILVLYVEWPDGEADGYVIRASASS